MPFLNGYLLGLGMIVFVGPVFIQLITVSIRNGIKPGIFLAFGIFISDILCVILCRYGNSLILLSEKSKLTLGLAGAALLLFLGVKTFLTNQEISRSKQSESIAGITAAFAKGFLVNFVNPFVFLVWFGVTAYSKSKYLTTSNEFFYLSGVLTGILTLDIIKVFLAKEIGRYLKADSHYWIYRVSGICLIGFSIRLLLDII